jgi:hypothetical protein
VRCEDAPVEIEPAEPAALFFRRGACMFSGGLGLGLLLQRRRHSHAARHALWLHAARHLLLLLRGRWERGWCAGGGGGC